MRKLSMKRKSKSDLNSSTVSNSKDQENNSDEESIQENDNISAKKYKRRSKKGKKSSNSFESNGTDDKESVSDEQYEVDTVLDQRSSKGIKQYLIRWKGYGAESDTWEPESTLNCPDLIEKFLVSQKSPSKLKKSSKSKKNKNEQENDEYEEEKKSKKSKRSEADSEAVVGEYEVDKIIEVHHKRNGEREFLVHWKGYSTNDNSWVPEDSMNCPELVERFMNKVSKAKESAARELRVNRKPTKHFTLTMVQIGRRISRRNLGKQRAQYKDTE